MWRHAVLLALALGAAGCAARTPAPPAPFPAPPPGEDPADLIARGCYRCLDQAFAEAKRRGDERLAFEAAALLALRSKELGLPYDEWMTAARTHAGPDAAPVLSALESIAPHPLSGDPDGVMNLAGRIQARTSLTAWRAALQTGPWSETFRAYVDLALTCAFGRVVENERSFTGPLDPVAETPLHQYRLGICDSGQAPRLAALRAGHPEFVDADFALGTYAAENAVAPDQEEGLRRLESAAAAFPRSPAIATTIGNVYRAWEEWADALEAYDRALALAPDHPEALIGRTISLSRLSRATEAIDTASRVIAGGRWRQGEAHYWRGWNYFVLEDFARARDDADRAKKLMANAPVFVLSGAIEWRLGRLPSAEAEFEQALLMDLGECEAAANLGVVRGDRGKIPEALAAFTQARQCYDLSMTLREDAIARIHSGPGTESARARAAAIHQRVLDDFRSRREEVLRSMERLQGRTRHQR
jgi:tetratricopeptide (TPR) repeat protein